MIFDINDFRLLGQNEDFMRSAVRFIEETLALAEIIRLLPTAIAPYV